MEVHWLCKIISSVAIFVLICSLIAMIMTVLWWLFPICSKSLMFFGRWIISITVTLWLLATRRLVIN